MDVYGSSKQSKERLDQMGVQKKPITNMYDLYSSNDVPIVPMVVFD